MFNAEAPTQRVRARRDVVIASALEQFAQQNRS